MEKKFKRTRTAKDFILSLSLLIIGGGLVAFTDIESAIYGGYVLILIGITLVFILKSAYTDTHNTYYKKSFSFSGEMKNSILAALKSAPASIQLSEDGKGQVLMLNMYYSKTSEKAYIQLFEYILNQYEPCSEMYEYQINEVNKLIE